jgi:guanosine-3',5'-bis(diphosphate) 3'-pyrophosphohydrolase
MAAIVARRLAEGREPGDKTQPKAPSAVMIRGTEGIAVQLARCCRPIPGDPIVGIVKKGLGLVVHTRDCPAITRRRGDRGKWIDAQWELESDRPFEVAIRMLAENKRGVLARIAAEIAEAGSDIQNVSMDDEKGVYTSLLFLLQVSNRDHLARIIRNLRLVPDVQRIYRVKGEGLGEERSARSGD